MIRAMSLVQVKVGSVFQIGSPFALGALGKDSFNGKTAVSKTAVGGSSPSLSVGVTPSLGLPSSRG